MNRVTSVFLFLLIATVSKAQTPAPAAAWTWNMGASLNGAQAQYRDWAPGGVNSVAATGNFFTKGKYTSGALTYATELNLRYGGAKIDQIGFQKTDDLLQFLNSVTYGIKSSPWGYYGLLNFNTQFYEGRNKTGAIISEFMAPAYLHEGGGIAWKPVPWFSAKAGLMLKQTYVSDTLFATGFGVEAGKNWRNEGGFSTGFRLEKEVMKNVLLKSGLDTFTNVEVHAENTDVMFTNELVGKINKYLSTNFQLALAYDSDIVKRIQVKQVLSVGLSVQFF